MEQNKITIEFFHDVLCAWCYALTPRIEKLTENHNGKIEVIHRSFALAKKPENIFVQGRWEKQILEHWRATNANDDEHRINAELMAQRLLITHISPGTACMQSCSSEAIPCIIKIFNRMKAHMTRLL